LEYEFRLEKETKEAERKRIEAKGIRDFQEIVSSGISEELLRWKGIEATSDLANSPNTKVVIVGSGKDGLPLILGGNN
jgi:regulator of protease activity HflC (stomatin/prohibitin superfamily)